MKVELRIPVNRVEGDLDIDVVIEDNVITDAKSIGVLYRGFENILKGKDPLDALVITPRVCGICSVSHLLASVKALEDAYGINPPAQAKRLRNISIMSENLQSDLRQFFLMFMPDFANEIYKNRSFYKKAQKLYKPFVGEMAKKTLDITKDIVKIIAYIGGQWPHTSYMVPGGLSIVYDDLETLRIKFLILKIKEWYENEVLGVGINDFDISSYEELKTFVNKHPNSQVSVFMEFCKETNLFNIGKSSYGFINFGSIDTKNGTKIEACFYDNKKHQLDTDKITEDVYYSYYKGEAENPFFEDTVVDIDKKQAYSFTKAPRYKEKVVQTGPLGEELALENPLFLDLIKIFGDSVFVRELARLLRGIRYIKWMQENIEEIILNAKEPIFSEKEYKENARGVGLTHAARGALGHWVEIEKGKIKRYQIISPTTWNGSPMDEFGQKGAWEKALIGAKIKDINNPIELGHIIRSFDPCLVCTVHYLQKDLRIKV